MVFSSIPTYLDASNWHQQPQQSHHTIGGGGSSSANHLLPPVPPPQHPPAHGGLRPGSMAERARLANIQIPEAALKCPRCDSTNTKFCYFNNYSLTQPRHFCKTCRRYWTRGGALRNVPVGGGCRRNKRSKTSSGSSTTTTTTTTTMTKSPASGDRRANGGGGANSSSNTAISTTNGGSLLGLNPQLPPPLRFISPLTHQLADAFTPDMVGLGYNGMAPPILGTNEVPSFTGNNNNNSTVLDTWRLQQYPFLSGLETSQYWAAGDSSFITGETSNNNNNNNNQVSVRPAPKLQNSILGGVKMEGTLPQLNISRHLIGGIQGGNEQWNNAGAGGAPWNELSSFSSSSTSNHL